jgi:hypothetical protein
MSQVPVRAVQHGEVRETLNDHRIHGFGAAGPDIGERAAARTGYFDWVHELDRAEAGRADNEVVFGLDAVNFDALFGDFRDLARFEGDVGLIEDREVVVADKDPLAANGVVGS